MNGKRSFTGPLLVLFAIVAVLAIMRLSAGGVAETPAEFASHTSLQEAIDLSERSGKPVLALATADWCGPCQALKRGALSDPRVAAWIEEQTVPAYVDLTDANDPEASRAGRLLGVSGIPTLVLLEDGGEVGRISGAVSADRLLEWLRETATRAAELRASAASAVPVAPTPED